jgi:hypothetical protein
VTKIVLPAQNISIQRPHGEIDPIWYEKLKTIGATIDLNSAQLAQLLPVGMTLLETIPLSGTFVVSSVPWAGYSHIKLLISNLSASLAAANTPVLQFHSSGAFQTTNYVSGATIVGLTGAPAFNTALTFTTAILIYGGTSLDTPTVPEGVSIETTIFNVNSTTTRKHVKSDGAVRAVTTSYWSVATGTWTGGNTAIDGIKLFLTGGASFVQGTLQIYGIK